DSTVTRKLAQAGMILLGKTHTVQFAYGSVGINHDHSTPHNPWQRQPHVPGGSSSGSAVAVASGLAPMGLGSDTGGSIRLPAGLCGTVGLKTTVGRISRAGIYPLSFTLDSAGPLCRSVEDAALVHQALIGEDLRDESTLGVAPQDVLRGLRAGVQGLRLAFAETVFFENCDAETARAVREAGRVLADLGATVTSIPFPEAREALELNPKGMISAVEGYAQNKHWMENCFDALDPVVAQRMRNGKGFSGPDYFLGLRRMAQVRAQALETLAHVDALLVPTSPLPALPVAQVDASVDTYMGYATQYARNTFVGNLLNLCGLSVPCGWTSLGLPIGLMIYCKPFQEDILLRIGHAYEQATPWHERRPDLSWAG
ncbi:MAG TPA: amidase, partial [bacterium]|nr:amidase [bacterium]